MRDMYSGISAAKSIAAEALDADNTPIAVDLQGFDSALIVLEIGAGGITFTSTNKIEFKLTESNDDSTYTAVADADVAGATVAEGGIIKSLVAAHATAGVYTFGYVGSKRYLKLLADFGGTHAAATPIAATILRGNANVSPVN